LDMTTV